MIIDPLAVKVAKVAVLHRVHEQHIEHSINVAIGREVRWPPQSGGVMNERDAEPNPALHLLPIGRPRVLTKFDRGLPSRNEGLHVQLVVFFRTHQVAELIFR